LALFASMMQIKRLYASGLVDFAEGVNIEDVGPERQYKLLGTKRSSLESLVLHPRTKLHSRSLDRLLQTPKKLKAFKYDLWPVG
jgi:hypothetical protein